MVSPHWKRLMVFVDGTNLLLGISREIDVEFKAEKPPSSAIILATTFINTARPPGAITGIRKYWFGSYQGNDDYQIELEELIRRQNYEPILFRKRKGREKGVDIALTMEMLVNAFNQNYDIALLVAGDEDYLGLVKEVKRYGPIVAGAYFKKGLSNRLRLAFDEFQYLNPNNINSKRYAELVEEIQSG